MVMVPRLRRLREQQALTQAELAERAGLSRVSVQKLERGGNARVSTARKLARALRVKPVELMAEEGNRDN